ncbi:MAG: GIY-YIG nuclease family protein [Candidatus Marinimicrobia bacterium]|nr:GIY-YIG nuclease family protein [Candidatus Neomarinimicrobiota bacterium]
MKDAYTYILSNKYHTTLYIGVTNDLERRMFEHKCGKGSKFCAKYKLHVLLYYEHHNLMIDAIGREKQLKAWQRKWKWDLIKEMNSDLRDLSTKWFDEEMLKNIEYCKNLKTLYEH